MPELIGRGGRDEQRRCFLKMTWKIMIFNLFKFRFLLFDLYSYKVHKNILNRADHNLLLHRAVVPSQGNLEMLARPHFNTASWLTSENVIRMKCCLFKLKSRTWELAFLTALDKKRKNDVYRCCLISDSYLADISAIMLLTVCAKSFQTCKNYLHMGVTIYNIVSVIFS